MRTSQRTVDFAELAPWCEVRYGPASGPGGQHVNKVSTRAILVFDFRVCPLLTDVQRACIAARCANRLTRNGRLRVVCQRARTQSANRRLAEQRLMELLAQALHVPHQRRPTRPTAASQRRRLEQKRRRGLLKDRRRSTPE
jgi:ribosome-associated protein